MYYLRKSRIGAISPKLFPRTVPGAQKIVYRLFVRARLGGRSFVRGAAVEDRITSR